MREGNRDVENLTKEGRLAEDKGMRLFWNLPMEEGGGTQSTGKEKRGLRPRPLRKLDEGQPFPLVTPSWRLWSVFEKSNSFC